MGANSGLRLSVLGPVIVILDDHLLPKLPTLRTQSLLIYLAVERSLGTIEKGHETFQIEHE